MCINIINKWFIRGKDGVLYTNIIRERHERKSNINEIIHVTGNGNNYNWRLIGDQILSKGWIESMSIKKKFPGR